MWNDLYIYKNKCCDYESKKQSSVLKQAKKAIKHGKSNA